MKIKEEQLKTIQDQQKELNNLFTEIGYIETQKHNMLHRISTISQSVDEFKKELERRRKKKREKNKFQNSSHTKSSRAWRARFEKISTDKDEQGGKQMHAYSLK